MGELTDAGDSEAAAVQGMLDTANADVTRLMGELTDAGDNAAATQGMLDTANADVTRLMGELTDAGDNAAATQGMLDTANADVTRLMGELTDAGDNAAATQGMLDTANADVTRLMGELTDAGDNAAATQGMLDTANGDVTRLTGELAMANTRADEAEAQVTKLEGELVTANEEIADIREKAKDVLAAADLADTIAREDEVTTAIEVSRVDTAVAMPSGGDVTGVTAERDADGVVTIDVNGEEEDDYTGGTTNADSGDWNSATLMKGTNTLVVYTNVEAPSDQDFADAYRTEVLNDALLVATVGKVAAAGFPSEPDTSWEYTGEEGGRETTVVGTFDGVDGQFTCTMVPCTVMTDSMGKLKAVAGWEFRADSQNTATVKKPDAAYAYFGWWLNKPEDNTMDHNVEVFAGAVGAAADVDALILGTAKYAGPAAGKYATKTFTAGVQTDAGVGHFTANAALTAKFGNAETVGTIDGLVKGFELDDGSSPNWEVILEEAVISGATFSGTTEVGLRRWCHG